MSRNDSARRALLAALAAAPFVALAQPARKPRIGTLMVGPEDPAEAKLFRRVETGLAAAGIPAVEWRVFRAASDAVPLMDAAARELVAWNPDAILVGGPLATMAVHKATKSIPVVFFAVPDPEDFGFVQSSGRPGGNVTGSASDGAAQTLKRLEVGREVLPKARRVAAVFRRRAGAAAGLLDRVRARFREDARRYGLEVREEDVEEGRRGFAATLATLHRQPPELLVTFGPYDWEPDGRKPEVLRLLLDFEARTRALVVFETDEAVDRGASLAVYGVGSTLTPAVTVLARVLKGASPAGIPVEYATRYAIAINAKAARARGLAIPASVLVRADRVID